MKILIISIDLILFAPATLSAHTALTYVDGGAGGLFHLSPDEDPFVDTLTGISIDLSGLENYNNDDIYPRLNVILSSNNEKFIPTSWHDGVLFG